MVTENSRKKGGLAYLPYSHGGQLAFFCSWVTKKGKHDREFIFLCLNLHNFL